VNPDRWQQIDRLLDEALDRKPEERPAFLEQACAADPGLRKEVEALLEAHAKAGSFVERPALGSAAAPRQHHPTGSLLGRRLGPYEVLSRIGRGGMGEVYQARDTRLGRRVALKILPSDFATDEERMRRFRREAKAASALSHANLATIYDVGESEGAHYIAMEYVEGKTLGELIGRKGMRLGEALNYGMQITDALAAAHETGIVHRDLKPGNVMVTAKGQVKVLDFGLAKWREKVAEGSRESTATEESKTEEGRIVGTVAYMSPEQAEGRPVDARSDIFSFGSVLYEMVTGRRAFQGETQASVLAAILKEDPRPASEVVEALPKEVERLISRCLRKDAERRYQHMHDLKVELQELKEDSESGRLLATPARARQFTPVRLVVVAVAIVAIAVIVVAGWYWFGQWRSTAPETQLVPKPLTAYPGYETAPSFSPDGNFVAFQRCGEVPGTDCDIYVKQIGVEPPFPLTSGPAIDFSPAWSPDGLFIAFLRQVSPSKSEVVLIPRTGGQARVLGESDSPRLDIDWGMPYLDWTPDSKWLVVPSAESSQAAGGLSLLSAGTLEKRGLTTPPAGFWDGTPSISPDGRTMAFTRWRGLSSDLYLLRLGVNYEPQGERHISVSTGEIMILAAAWTPDGTEIVLSSQNYSFGSLWRMAVSASAKPRRLPVASESPLGLAVSRKGDRLAYLVETRKSSIWRVDLGGTSQAAAIPFPLIRSTRNQLHPAYSPDGRRVAFASNISGHAEIWVCNSDGSNAEQLTSIGANTEAPAWSPDGRSIVFSSNVGGNELDVYVVGANGGSPQRLTTGLGGTSPWPSWSRDGQSIYLRSHRGGSSEIWKMPAAGGEAVQITHNTGDLPQESLDGKLLYYMKGDRYPVECSVWRMPVGGGEESRVLSSVHCDGRWAVGKRGIYFFAKPDDKGHTEIRLYELATGKTTSILMLERRVSSGIVPSPDGRTILFAQFDEEGSDLMLVENFR
jgi:eukaryotic-like serine/threonine-protein kinase